MATLEELSAIEQIKRAEGAVLPVHGHQGLGRLPGGVRADATMDTTQEAPDLEVVRGNENIRQFVEGAVGPVVTVHHGHMPEIEITSPTTASGVWAMQDFLQMPEGSPLGMKSMTGWGHYTETYELVGGEWLIKTLLAHAPAA